LTESTKPPDESWPRGFDAHQLEQLRRLAMLPLWAKLEWLEEAQRLAGHMQGQASPESGENAGSRSQGTPRPAAAPRAAPDRVADQ